MLDQAKFRVVAISILALVSTIALYFVAIARWWDAVALVALIAPAALFIALQHRLPSVFTLLCVTAGLINALGYIFNLWIDPAWFDEAVHAYSSFAIAAPIGWLLFHRTHLNAADHWIRFALIIAAVGLALGIAWEVFEWIIGIIGSTTDTLVDLVADTLGSIGAGLFCSWAATRERHDSGIHQSP